MVIKFAILLALSTYSVNSLSSGQSELPKEMPHCKCAMMMKATKGSTSDAACKCGCPMMKRMKKEREDDSASKGQQD